MNRLRASIPAKAWLLALYLLVLVAGGVTPWTNASAFAQACSVAGDDHRRAYDCPACLPLQAPPPANAQVPSAPAEVPLSAVPRPTRFPAPSGPALPPVRGPPSV